MIKINYNIKKNLIYLNKYNFLYADYTGTGQSSPLVDNFLIKHIYPYYANIHSNSTYSKIISNYILKSKEYIKKVMNVSNNQCIIFTGNGTTGAINHLVNSLDFQKYNKINIIISLYEHHSNYLPWVEKSKKYTNINIFIIPLTNDGNIDYEWYNKLILRLNDNDLTITSITACSNVSGIITDIYKFKNNKSLLFIDYACLAPYKNINASFSDACFISPHKFIGGISTPGILIVNKNLFTKSCPYAPGGGCVKIADDNEIIYEDDIEKRETGGTPNIIGIIRIKLILMIKNKYLNIINNNEKILVEYIHNKLSLLTNKYNNLTVLYLNKCLNNRLPIICISIKEYHYNDIVKIMSNLFKIQTRGGISCCGLLARYIKNNMNINGWCRITFHWLMNINEINYILDAIEFISSNKKI